jgi:hypothetical protein
MTKQRLLLLALVLFAGAISAHAQAEQFCIFVPDPATDQTLMVGQSAPPVGFVSYSCPYPPAWVELPLIKHWVWMSTCPQGGIVIQGTVIGGNNTQINVESGIFDPNTGRRLGHLSGFAVVPYGAVPEFIPTDNSGGPCKPYTRDNILQSTATETQ